MSQDTCSLDECDRPRRSRGWCNAHYLRYRAYGDPTAGNPLKWQKSPGDLCMSPRCNKPIRCKSLCASHYTMFLNYGRITELTADDRFWAKVVEGEAGCWLWTGAVSSQGYGNAYRPDREGGSATSPFQHAHRYAYEALRADIPSGLALDHLCRIKLCVNPWHLEPVSPMENLRRALMLGGLTGATSIKFMAQYRELRAHIRAESGSENEEGDAA